MNTVRFIKNFSIYKNNRMSLRLDETGFDTSRWQVDYEKIAPFIAEYKGEIYAYIPHKLFFTDGKTNVAYVAVDSNNNCYDIPVVTFDEHLHQNIPVPTHLRWKASHQREYDVGSLKTYQCYFRSEQTIELKKPFYVEYDHKSNLSETPGVLSGPVVASHPRHLKQNESTFSLDGFTLNKQTELGHQSGLVAYEIALQKSPRLMKTIRQVLEPVIKRMVEYHKHLLVSGKTSLGWQKMMENTEQNAISFYLMTYQYLNGDTIVHKNRLQAVESMPFIITSLLRASYLGKKEFSDYTDGDQDEYILGSVIDNAEPFIPALCKLFNIDNATVRFLEKHASFSNFHGAPHAWITLAHTNNKMSLNEREDNIEFIAAALHGKPVGNSGFYKMAVNFIGERIRKLGFDRGIPRARIGIVELNDFLKNIQNSLSMTGLIDNGMTDVVHQLAGGTSWKHIERLINWYEIYGSRLYALSFVDLTWKSESERVRYSTTINDRTFHFSEIINGREMFDEGTNMEHCVASYIETAYMGRNFIFHCEEEDTDNMATLEIEYGRKEWQNPEAENEFLIHQFMGKRNAEMDDVATAAAEKFLTAIKNEEVRLIISSGDEFAEKKAFIERIIRERTEENDEDFDSFGVRKFNFWKHCLQEDVSPYHIDYDEIINTYYGDSCTHGGDKTMQTSHTM